MINTQKLLTNRSNRSTSLSRISTINIGLIRQDVKKIDGLLKSRLVLSKVREGIERQNQERLKRKSREEELERDDDRDDDPDRRQRKTQKRGRGLLGLLVGGIIAIVGGLVIRFLPTILKVVKFFKKIAKPFTAIIGGSFATLFGFISGFNERANALQGIDKDEVKPSRIEKTFDDFSGALDSLVTSLIIGGAISMGLKGIKGKNAKTAVKNLKKEAAPRKMRKRRSDAKSYSQVKREIDLREYDSLTPEAKARIRRENISRTLREAEEVIPNRKPRVQREDFLGMNKPRKGAEFTGPDDLLQTQRQRSARRITTNVTDKAIQDAIKKGRNIKTEFGDPLNIEQEIFKKESGGKKVKVSPTSKKVKRLLKKSKQTDLELGKTIDQESLELSKGFSQKTQRFIKKNVKAGEKLRNKILGGGDTFNPLNNLKEAPMGEFGFSTSGPINPNKFFKTNRQILEGTDLLSTPKIPQISQSLLKQRGGIVKVLSNIGGDAFVQTFKQGLKGSIGVIPILGDVFGFLLDYFVFGEPVGRAAFKAIGSFALSSLIGAVGLALGGPVGAFIGGMLGGIGGDILGGIAYDLFFGTEGGVSAKSSATKGVVKGATTQAFKQGGFVGPEPSVQPLVNSVDRSTDLRVTASYDKPSAGRVKFVPIPLPIPKNEQQEEQQIAMNKTTTKTRTFAGLYQR